MKRLWRFVANTRFKPEALFASWIRWIIKTFAGGKQVTIAVDWTEFPGKIRVLMVAIPIYGRAIPLYWKLTRHSDISDSQNLYEERFMTKLLSCLPNDREYIFVFDRGFGRATFIQFLKDKQVSFVIRVKADVYITTKKDRTILLRDQLLKPNITVSFKNATYREDRQVKNVTIIGITIAESKDDPWWLVTNLSSPEQAIRVYEKRFDIEEWFRDLKHELDIDTIYTKRIQRVRVILCAACISYGLLMLAGKLAKRYPAWIKRVVTNSAYSLIFLALRLIEAQIPHRRFWYRWVRLATAPGG